MKPTHLKTLSAYVKQLKNSRIDYQSHVEAIEGFDAFLDTIVTLAHFVPCDANGVPLEKPKGKNPKRSIWEPYNEAQKNVIFEGWEVVRFDGEYLYIVNKESDIELEFNIQDGVVEVNLNQSTLCNLYGNVTTYADLAAATKENPLKLK